MNEIKFPFYLKLSLIISLLIIIIVVGISYILLNQIKTEYREQIKRTSNVIANLIVKYSVEPVVMENYSSLYNILANLQEDPDTDIVQIAILDPHGIIRVSTNRNNEGKQFETEPSMKKETTFTFNGDYLDVIAPILAYDNFWGYLKFRYSLSGLENLFVATKYQILLLALIFIGIGLLISFLIAKAIVKPINTLVARSKDIAQGDFSNPIAIRSRDEFGFLGETLEDMRINLKYFISDVAKKAIGYEGDLKIFSLPTLLRLFNTIHHSGGLVLKKENKLGVIYFINGEIVDAVLDNLKGKKALFRFFSWQSGDFKFSPHLQAQQIRIKDSFKELILSSVRQVQDQQIFRQVLPSDEIIVAPAVAGINELAKELALNNDEECLLRLVDAQRNIKELKNYLNWSEEKIYEILYRLISIGLISSQIEDDLETYIKEKELTKNVIPFPEKSKINS